MNSTGCRKSDHIRICLEEEVEYGSSSFEDVSLIHQALTDLDYDKINTSIEFLGKQLAFPLIIAAMTGGCEEAVYINRELARIAEKKSIGFGLGSQRAMIEDPSLKHTYMVRDDAQEMLLLGNIGITALKQYSFDCIMDAVKTVGADAVCVHINPAQELFQNEGDSDFSGCTEILEKFCRFSSLPVIGKEVGNGISTETAKALRASGVTAIDVGGWGGTNWVVVDGIRSGCDPGGFADWGIPTSASILESRVGLPLIATGGVRTGLHMAKAIALGADVCGIALPFLRLLMTQGKGAVEDYIDSLKHEFMAALYLTGSQNVAHLKKARFFLTGVAQQWCADADGLDAVHR